VNGSLVNAAVIPNPDRQVWEILIPGGGEGKSISPSEDCAEKMIEEGED